MINGKILLFEPLGIHLQDNLLRPNNVGTFVEFLMKKKSPKMSFNQVFKNVKKN